MVDIKAVSNNKKMNHSRPLRLKDAIFFMNCFRGGIILSNLQRHTRPACHLSIFEKLDACCCEHGNKRFDILIVSTQYAGTTLIPFQGLDIDVRLLR
ncbi:hypothetical protein DK47_3045 [Brucella abortus 2308]|nr:hypothetical protein DK47_3045 [Brucella abortus 2308]